MTKAYLFTCGLRHATEQSICIIENPHRILGMKRPKEAFSGKRPDVGHFRIFGSSVYCHVTNDARKKLEPTAELAILVGYIDTPHNYRVYLPTSQRIIVRRDLKFDELKAM